MGVKRNVPYNDAAADHCFAGSLFNVLHFKNGIKRVVNGQ